MDNSDKNSTLLDPIRGEQVLVEVPTGVIKISCPGTMLAVSALGSCIAVVAYDQKKQVGGIAHVMLPGAAPSHQADNCLRYADNAVSELVQGLVKAGAEQGNIAVCLVGGSNVLKRSDDSICESNIQSVRAVLERLKVPVLAHALGGMERRRVRLELERGHIYHAQGDGQESLLYQPA